MSHSRDCVSIKKILGDILLLQQIVISIVKNKICIKKVVRARTEKIKLILICPVTCESVKIFTS